MWKIFFGGAHKTPDCWRWIWRGIEEEEKAGLFANKKNIETERGTYEEEKQEKLPQKILRIVFIIYFYIFPCQWVGEKYLSSRRIIAVPIPQ